MLLAQRSEPCIRYGAVISSMLGFRTVVIVIASIAAVFWAIQRVSQVRFLANRLSMFCRPYTISVCFRTLRHILTLHSCNAGPDGDQHQRQQAGLDAKDW